MWFVGNAAKWLSKVETKAFAGGGMWDFLVMVTAQVSVEWWTWGPADTEHMQTEGGTTSARIAPVE